jgi:hypothetical protein
MAIKTTMATANTSETAPEAHPTRNIGQTLRLRGFAGAGLAEVGRRGKSSLPLVCWEGRGYDPVERRAAGCGSLGRYVCRCERVVCGGRFGGVGGVGCVDLST